MGETRGLIVGRRTAVRRCTNRRRLRRALLAVVLASSAAVSLAAPPAGAVGTWQLRDSAGLIANPTGVAAGPQGRMWYSNSSLNQLRSGNGIASVDLAGHFTIYRTPAATSSIAVLPGGVVYATEDPSADQHKLVRLSPRGQASTLSLPSPGSQATDMVKGGDGNAWFIDQNPDQTAGHLGRVTPGGQITEFQLPDLPEPDGSTVPALPAAVAPGPGSTLWVAANVGMNQGVYVFNTNGSIVKTISYPAAYGSPAAIAVTPQGTAWMTTDGFSMIEIPAGGSPVQVPLPGNTQAGSAIGLGPDGNVYFDANHSPGLWRIGPQGPTQFPFHVDVFQGSSVTPNAIEGLTGVDGLAPGPAGTLWLSASLIDANGASVDSVVVVDLGGRCIVPNLSFDTRTQARRALADHDCRLGRVNVRPNLGSPLVRRQSPAPGAVRPAGALVSVTLAN